MFHTLSPSQIVKYKAAILDIFLTWEQVPFNSVGLATNQASLGSDYMFATGDGIGLLFTNI